MAVVVFSVMVKLTSDYAQTLYEKKLLTYPRTDSQSPRYGFA